MKKRQVLAISLSLSCLLLAGLIAFAIIYPAIYGKNHTVSVESIIGKSDLENEESSVSYNDTGANDTETLPSSESPKEAEDTFQEYSISLMAVGDNLLHMGLIHTGKQDDGTYDFSFLFDGISGFLENADIKMINQETILGGNQLGFSGFPRFNSPTEVGDAIATAGFNVVLQASNHTADQKLEGLKNCAAFWETYPDILLTGIYKSKEAPAEIPLLTIDDVTFAVLNYTYGPNAETLPSSIEGHLNILCNYDENNHLDFTTINPKVLEDIAYAETIADVVIVSPHWGTEYMTKPSSYQEEFAEQMTEAGADLIIGTHPHVVQPVQWILADNGNRALCFYSLGNYVSTQKNGLSMLEAMAWVTFHVTKYGITISEANSGVIPMVCQYKSGPVRFENVYILEDYTEDLAASHGIHSYGGVNLTLSDLQEWSMEILGNWVLTKEEVLNQSHSVSQ